MNRTFFGSFSAAPICRAAAFLLIVCAGLASEAAAAPDVAITKTDNRDPVNAGDNLSYTITVSNIGDAPAESVSWSDTLPDDATFWSLTTAAGWTCTTPALRDSGTVTCSRASLPAGTVSTFTLTVIVSEEANLEAALANTAMVASTSPDANGNNNNSTATTAVQPATLAANKSVSGETAPGSTITYAIVLTNNKLEVAQQDNPGDEVIDTLPSSLTLVSADASRGVAVADLGTNTVRWNGGIPAQDSVTIVITATINSGTEEQAISNTATVNYDADGNGTNEATKVTNEAIFEVTAGNPNEADLAITKTADRQQTLADRDVTFTIEVSSGSGTGDDAVWTDTLPGDMTFVSFTQQSGPLWSCTTPAIGAGGTVTCTNESVDANTTSVFTLVAHVPAETAAGTEYTNIASISSAADPNNENDSGAAAVTVVNTQVTVASSLNPSTYGDSVTFTATVSSADGTPTGTVQFNIDGVNVGPAVPLNGSGTATFTTSALTGGTHTVTATYNGNVGFSATSGSLPGGQVVNRAATSPNVSSSPNPSTEGQAVTFTATVSSSAGTPSGTVQFQIDGANAGAPVPVNANGTANFTTSGLSAGTHSVTANYEGDQNFAPSSGALSGGQTVQPAPTPTPTATPTPSPSPSPSASPSPSPSKSLNIATRGRVGTGDRVLIAGTIITGSAAKKVIFRAIGPSLTKEEIADALADPVLELYGPDGSLIRSNDNWKDAQQAEIEASGLKPEDDRESAIVATLMPNNYTAIVRGKANTANPQGTEGIALGEIYDLDTAAASKLANISTRAFVQTEQGVVIGGFLLGGSTSGTTDVVIRALGPTLNGKPGIASNTLADPTLELRDSNGTLLRKNDNWQEDAGQAAQITADGLAPENPVESAIFATLPPGDYTAIVAGKDGGVGVGLIEVYNLR